MTTLTIELPEALARQAQQAGVLEHDQLVALIDQAVRTRSAAVRLQQLAAKLEENPLPSMSAAEIQAEIDAYRSEKRAKTGH